MGRSIVIACDLGPQLAGVVEAGVAFADALEKTPVLVHVDAHPMLFLESLHAVAPEDLARMKQGYRERALEQLRQTVRGIGRDTHGIEALIREGRPDVRICEAASELDAEAIVVGTEVHGVIDHLLVGRTAHRVIRASQAAVLTANLRGPWQGLSRILYATDLAEGEGPASQAESWAARLAGKLGARLSIVHVSQLGSDFAAPYVFPPRALDKLREALSQRLEALRVRMIAEAASHGMGAETVSSHLLFAEDTARTLADAAKHDRANLIIVGTHGRSGLRRALLGSVAEGVLRHATTSVLTVHEFPRE